MSKQGEAATPAHALPSYWKNEVFCAGLVSGVSVAGIFNFWDRALYLSVKHKRNFMDPLNFKHAYRGFFQSLGHRTLAGGMYFPLCDIFRERLVIWLPGERTSQDLLVVTCAGNLAGMFNGVVLNKLSAIKYHMWGHTEGANFWATARIMYREGGWKPFVRGTVPTLIRDTIFGGSYMYFYFVFRTKLLVPHSDSSTDGSHHTKRMCASVSAAAIATVFSSPFNFVRNMMYATSPGVPCMTTLASLKRFKKQVASREKPWSYLQQRLRIGFGTARVAFGMAIGNEIYLSTKTFMEREV
jgi:hypothetical protein